MTLLSARGVSLHFGGVRAVDQLDFDLEMGEIHAIIGPNGAGKTSFVSLLSGRLRPQSGKIFLGGRDITALPAHRRVAQGIAYTFQITSIYQRLSVFENVALAAQHHDGDLSDHVTAALSRVGLQDFIDQQAGTMSYGHQRMLEIAMGLALKPKVLILDEPTQGLGEQDITLFKALVRSLVPQTTVLMIEHNMDVVMDLAHRITVLNFGQRLASGSPEEIRANPVVQAAYLGTEHA